MQTSELLCVLIRVEPAALLFASKADFSSDGCKDVTANRQSTILMSVIFPGLKGIDVYFHVTMTVIEEVFVRSKSTEIVCSANLSISCLTRLPLYSDASKVSPTLA